MLDENRIDAINELVNDENVSDKMLNDLFSGDEVFTFSGGFFNGVDLLAPGILSGTSTPGTPEGGED